MNTTRRTPLLRLDVSLWSVALVVVLTLAIGASEGLLYYGHVWYTIWAYSLLLLAITLGAIVLENEISVLQAFALIPVFRLVNLTVPNFFDLTLFWLPLIYGPFIPMVVYLGRQSLVDELPALRRGVASRARANRGTGEPTGAPTHTETMAIRHELPWWLGGSRGKTLRRLARRAWKTLAVPEEASLGRSILHWVARGLLVVLLPLAVVAFLVLLGVVTVYLAEFEYGIITPAPLIPSLTVSDVAILTVIMIVFVGFVEELLFRGILQKVLERRLGLVPGLLLASGIFALMHSGHGVPMAIAFAGGAGLLFGVVYDVTDSLVLVAVMHGGLNVLLFGVIPLDGASSIDLLQAIILQELQRAGLWWIVETVPLPEVWMLVGVF